MLCTFNSIMGRYLQMRNYIALIRPKSWVKNGIVFLPLFFHGSLLQVNALTSTFYAFFTFCIAASFVYILNDIRDVDYDKLHFLKKKRPIASGVISIKQASVFAITLLLFVFILCVIAFLSFGIPFSLFIFSYIALNIAYCFGGKNIPLIDVFSLSIGFLLRLYLGAYVTGIPVSDWLYLTILCGSLYLSFGKRKNELENSPDVRSVLYKYTIPFLTSAVNVCLVLSITFYSLWCISTHPLNKFTIPLFLFTILKYHITLENSLSGDPIENIFKDKLLLLFAFLLFIMMFFIQYLYPNM